MCIEPYVYNTAAYRDNFTGVRYICFDLRIATDQILFFRMLIKQFAV